jgi:hypothetical protein
MNAQPASSSPFGGRKFRVVQWATGNVGTRSLRAVIEHPDYTLVGLYVHSPSKVGKDAGEFCGLGPVGIKATNKIDDILALKADCVLYMQQGHSVDDVCRILASGTNIVSTVPDFHHPDFIEPAARQRIEEACRQGNSSIHCTGSSPGFITESLPIVLTSLQRRLDLVTIDEYADVSSRDSPEMLFEVMRFGKPPFKFDEHSLEHVRRHYGGSLAALADSLSIPLDSFESLGEAGITRSETKIAAGVVPKGTLGAQRITVTGMRKGKPTLRFRANWYVTRDVEPSLDLRETGWRVLVEGDTPLKVDITFPVPLEKWAAFTPSLTAHPPVNAVPYVCAAPPGIRSGGDLRVIPLFA